MVNPVVNRIFQLLVDQARRPFLASPLQLALAGLLMFYLAMGVGADYACSGVQLGAASTAFSCRMGDMPMFAKLAILGLMALASLACGRAASLLEGAAARREQ